MLGLCNRDGAECKIAFDTKWSHHLGVHEAVGSVGRLVPDTMHTPLATLADRADLTSIFILCTTILMNHRVCSRIQADSLLKDSFCIMDAWRRISISGFRVQVPSVWPLVSSSFMLQP